MSDIRKLKLYLYIAADGIWSGPMDLNTYCHHNPGMLLNMKEALGIPRPASKIYNLDTNSFLSLADTYESQAIRKGQTVIVTDIENSEVLQALSDAYRVTTPPSSIDQYVQRLPDATKKLAEEIPYVGKALASLLFGSKSS